MNVIVCVKQIPDPALPGELDPSTNTLKRAAVISDRLVLEAADLTIRKPETNVTPIGDLIHDVVIETYLRLGSAIDTAKVLGLRRPVVRHHIKVCTDMGGKIRLVDDQQV